MKIFRVNDYEWWAAENAESIRSAYKEATGIDPDSEEGFDGEPVELSDAEMDTQIVSYVDGPEKCESTFRQRLNELIALGAEFPCHFAGTEYWASGVAA